MRYNKKYLEKMFNAPFPPLPDDERIYFNVPYAARDFAKYAHCGFDPEKKLWFTGCFNSNLYVLVKLYGINEATSEKARQLMTEQLEKSTPDNEQE